MSRLAETALAVRFRYYGWLLWIPRSALSHVGDAYTAPAWAIDTAREHESAVHFSDEREALDEVDWPSRGSSRSPGPISRSPRKPAETIEDVLTRPSTPSKVKRLTP